MRILVAAVTAAEVAPLSAAAGIDGTSAERLRRGRLAGHDIDLLVTGVGMVPTACWCANTFARGSYQFALNLGLCGAFDRALVPASVVHVTTDRFSELGAEDGDAFLTLHDLGLVPPDDPLFTNGAVINDAPPDVAPLLRLSSVSGITVNTVHGREASIADAMRRFAPQVESMEGAAFMYACAIAAVPYAQVRAVSNVVERRNRAAWQIGPAIAALSAAALEILESA
jgi:futalosine hydrolase